MLSSLLLVLSIALADEVELEVTPEHCVVSKTEPIPHGPEKPPPDDGYEFKSGGSGNLLGKLGLVMVLSSAVTGGLTLAEEKGEPKRQNLGYATGGLFLGGLTLLIIERST